MPIVALWPRTGYRTAILAAAAAVDADQPATLDAAAQQIAGLFAQHGLPDDLAATIRQAYAALGDQLPVAVRSSATAEDLPDLSFAGQQDSYLNMRGDAMLLDAVKRCWASLWTARAIGYRARHGIPAGDVSLAVVVQELVLADAPASCSPPTRSPARATRLLINAAWGLGEAIVGGQVTPDTVVVDKASGAVIEQQISAKELMTVRTADGTHEVPVPAEQREQAVLSTGAGGGVSPVSARRSSGSTACRWISSGRARMAAS